MIACRKCHANGTSIVLHEIVNGVTLEFLQNQNGTIDPEGVLLRVGDPVRVLGLCLECAHKWTLRGIRQIVNLAGHPNSAWYRPPASSVPQRGPSGEREVAHK